MNPPAPATRPPIRALCLDVDGVLTAGGIVTDEDGRQLRVFHVHDGFAISWFQKLGGTAIICSGKRTGAVDARARELGIAHVIQASRDKLAEVSGLLESLGIGLHELAMVGDDLPDYALMKAAALPIAVANAVDEIRQIARYVTTRPGGEGAVREAIEYIMRTDGRWDEVLRRHGASAPSAAAR